jgi:hypothetical protein
VIPPVYAVIPSNGRDCLTDCLTSIQDQVDYVVIVANGPGSQNGTALLPVEAVDFGPDTVSRAMHKVREDYEADPFLQDWVETVAQSADASAAPLTIRLPVSLLGKLTVIGDTGTDRNIQRWWNIGLDTVQLLAEASGHDQWNVLVLNDDVICPPGTVSRLSEALREYNAVAAYPNQHDELKAVYRLAEPIPLHRRMTGYAFLLDGTWGLRADEDFVWWFGDDDLFWRANELGGSVLVPGCRVVHQFPDGWQSKYPELVAQTPLDRETFVRKWGKAPW